MPDVKEAEVKRVERRGIPQVGEYYRAKESFRVEEPDGDHGNFEKDDIVCVQFVNPDQPLNVSGGRYSSFPFRKICSWINLSFLPEPDVYVAGRIQDEVKKIALVMSGASAGAASEQHEMRLLQESMAIPVDSEQQSALSLQTKAVSAAKKAVATQRNAMMRYAKNVKEHRGAIQRWLEVQEEMLDQKMGVLNKSIEQMEECVWTINLYMGRDEHVKRIKSGKAAPRETPIALRQLVLFMDEECALRPGDGGIDFMELDEFDKWLRLIPRTSSRLFRSSGGWWRASQGVTLSISRKVRGRRRMCRRLRIRPIS